MQLGSLSVTRQMNSITYPLIQKSYKVGTPTMMQAFNEKDEKKLHANLLHIQRITRHSSAGIISYSFSASSNLALHGEILNWKHNHSSPYFLGAGIHRYK